MAHGSGFPSQSTGPKQDQPYTLVEKGVVAAGTFLGMAVGTVGKEGAGSMLGGALGFTLASKAVDYYKTYTAKGTPLYLKQGWATPVTASNPREAMAKLLDMPEQQGERLREGNFSKVQKFMFREGEPFVIKWAKDSDYSRGASKDRDIREWFGLEKGEVNGLRLNQHPQLIKTHALLIQDSRDGHYVLINDAEQIKAETRPNYRVKAVINEFVDGLDLRHAPGGVPEENIESILDVLFSSDQAIKLGLPVCEALEYLHRNGVVYRDLKPENIMIRRHDHEVKVVDLGFSKKLPPADRTSTICGTPEYMAPEVIRGEKPYGFESDAWSLGILLLEMSTGVTPNHLSIETDKIVEASDSQHEQYQRVINFAAADNEAKRHFLWDHFPDTFFDNEKLLNLIVKLTDSDPEKRLKIEEACQQLKAMRQTLKSQERLDWVFSKLRLY
ncbi:protein kinase domain-containing protein [Endozoicomonas numazuensis]|uniref:Protein kinase domain-containing protein n=1 Tax=Endozoicomonas numazuensis TaxID=1137799 RepID=A0A081NGS3_9GAMM|nr:protein kinase [Endozoicomonas numazuensis]KEQ17646.1 hypothetical protein GZ78_18165 [Endozoicomonas numazuensis]